jgi:hypothetical protein
MQLATGTAFRKDIYFQQTGYIPHAGQIPIHLSNARHRVLCNGRRWGKTLLGAKEAEVMAFVKNFLGQPQWGWIVGPEYSDCEKEFRVIYDSLKKLGVDSVSSKFTNNTDNGNMHIKTNWGFDLQCRSARHPESLVGEGLDFVLLVEAGRHKRSTWGDYIRPALSDKRGWSLFTGVPEGSSETSLLYAMYQRGKDPRFPQWVSWRKPSWTNPVVFPGGRKDPEILEAEADLTEEEFQRQYEAKFVEHAGRVMKEWDDEKHLVDLRYNPLLPVYMAVDFGYTNDWVLLWIQVDDLENIYVIRERRWQYKDTDEICDIIKNDPTDGPLSRKAVALYPDPAAPDDANIIARKLKVQPRAGTGGEIRTRVALIRKALKDRNPHLVEGHKDRYPKLRVDRRCTKLAWEMREGYRWPENKRELEKNDSENPMDKDNHGPEALGRFFAGYFGTTDEVRRAKQSKAKFTRAKARKVVRVA